MLLFKVRWGILGLFAVFVSATIAYRYIEGWTWLESIWMVVITLTTIGYGEIRPLSTVGRVFTIGMIIVGVALGTYTVGQVTRYVLEGELGRDLVTRRRRRQMRKLHNHFIVVGFGRLGREVAQDLHHRHEDVVGVDMTERFFEDQAYLTMFVVGDATLDRTLEEAAIQHARGIAVATGSDSANIFITLSARQLNPQINILTRITEESSAAKALRAGANAVINPYGISGTRMARGLLTPHAAPRLDSALGRGHTELDIEDVALADSPGYNGPLGDLRIPERHKVLVVAVRKPSGQLMTAIDRGTLLNPGDVAVVVGHPDDVIAFAQAAGGKKRTSRGQS
jgi:voltage-gated potassium channel